MRTGTAIGFRACHELCSNFLFSHWPIFRLNWQDLYAVSIFLFKCLAAIGQRLLRTIISLVFVITVMTCDTKIDRFFRVTSA